MQLAADQEHGFIVDVETVDDPQDASQLPAAMERIKTNLGRYPEQALADGGYTNHPTVVAMAEREIDFYGVMMTCPPESAHKESDNRTKVRRRG